MQYALQVSTIMLLSFFIIRSQVHLHLMNCDNKAEKCTVKGCNNLYLKRGKYFHDVQYQESHQVLLGNEVEMLRSEIFTKVCFEFFSDF